MNGTSTSEPKHPKVPGYSSKSALMADIKSRRYRSDPKFRANVDERWQRTPFDVLA